MLCCHILIVGIHAAIGTTCVRHLLTNQIVQTMFLQRALLCKANCIAVTGFLSEYLLFRHKCFLVLRFSTAKIQTFEQTTKGIRRKFCYVVSALLLRYERTLSTSSTYYNRLRRISVGDLRYSQTNLHFGEFAYFLDGFVQRANFTVKDVEYYGQSDGKYHEINK